MDTPTPQSPKKGRALALTIVLLAFFMDLLDTTIVNVAIPSIQAQLGASYAAMQWVIAGYSLTFALLLITGGRLGDIFGYKRLFLIGIGGFTLSSVLAGASVNPEMLIISRLIQGVMAALMVPQVLSIIQVLYEPKERSGVSAFYGALGGLAAVGGPIIGALLINSNIFDLSWRSIFYVNVPVGILALIAGAKFLPNAKSPHPLKVDTVGVGLITSALLLLIYPLLQGRDLGWPTWTFWMMAASLPVFALFGWYERRKDRKDGSPLVVPQLFRIRSFVATSAVSIIFFGAMTSFFLTMTLLMQIGLGYSVLKAGLIGIPFSIGVGFMAGLSGQKLTPKFGRIIIGLGALIMALGMGLFAWVIQQGGPGVPVWHLLTPLFVGGLGMGMVVASFVGFALSGVPLKAAGSASGLLSTFQQVASSVGIALIGVVFFGGLAAQANNSVTKVEPQIRQQLAAEHLPAQAQDAIVSQFRTCFNDRAREKDSSVIPASCQVPQNQAASKVGDILAAAGKEANAYNFIGSFSQSVVYMVVGLVLAALLTLFLPKFISHEVEEAIEQGTVSAA